MESTPQTIPRSRRNPPSVTRTDSTLTECFEMVHQSNPNSPRLVRQSSSLKIQDQSIIQGNLSPGSRHFPAQGRQFSYPKNQQSAGKWLGKRRLPRSLNTLTKNYPGPGKRFPIKKSYSYDNSMAACLKSVDENNEPIASTSGYVPPGATEYGICSAKGVTNLC